MGNRHRTYLHRKTHSQSSAQPINNKRKLSDLVTQRKPQGQSLEEMRVSRKNAEHLGDHLVNLSGSKATAPIQTKLAMGQGGDKYEQEADATAAKVAQQINNPSPHQALQSKSVKQVKETGEQPIQRFLNFEQAWDSISDFAEDAWDAFTGTGKKKENGSSGGTTEEVENKKKSESKPKKKKKSKNKKTPGIPDKPELEHPEFAAIVEEMAEMEENPLDVESKHKEEKSGEERTARVKKIGELRGRIAALGTAIPDVDAEQIKQAQAYLYRRLAPLAPYFGQMANTNMLTKTNKKGGKGWDRTCNVTVPAMVLEGIGKTKDNYVGSKQVLQNIFAALEGKYKERKVYEAAADFDSLRLPDFMALVGIAKHVSGSGDVIDDVSQARTKAAKQTTHHNTMMYLIEQFGGKHKKDNVHHNKLDKIGGAQKAYTKAELRNKNPEEWRSRYQEINEELQQYSEGKEREEAFKKLKKKDKNIYQTLWKYDNLNKEEAEKLLPVDTYREAVLKKINPLLDSGAQILVGMEGHFVRLDGLDKETIQVDDPGEKGFKSLQVTWEQARGLGYFKGFWSITS